jgi:hypothetical protein
VSVAGHRALPPLELRQRPDDYLAREFHPTLVAELKACGGLWVAGDAYTSASEVVAQARDRKVDALGLDFRDLSLLRDLPDLLHLEVSSDRRPVLDPIASLTRLRSLTLHTSAMRGELDPLGFPDLRWLTLPLGGKGGAAMLPSMLRGHPALEHLKVRETKAKTVAELVSGFPRLRSFAMGYADHVRTLGDLSPVAGTLRELDLWMVPGFRSIEGIDVLTGLERLRLHASKLIDLSPLDALPRLRHVDVRTGTVTIRRP